MFFFLRWVLRFKDCSVALNQRVFTKFGSTRKADAENVLPQLCTKANALFEDATGIFNDSFDVIIAHQQYQTFLDHAMRVFHKLLQVNRIQFRKQQ
mgnify:CR=1 FL=1